MSSDEATNPSPLVPFTELWSGFFAYIDCQNQAILGCLEPIADPRILRKRWLETASRAFDDWFRSPAFLLGLEASLKTLIDAKAFQNDLMLNWWRQFGVPLASDVDELAERLPSTETLLVTHLRVIAERLSNIENELDAVTHPLDRNDHDGRSR